MYIIKSQSSLIRFCARWAPSSYETLMNRQRKGYNLSGCDIFWSAFWATGTAAVALSAMAVLITAVGPIIGAIWLAATSDVSFVTAFKVLVTYPDSVHSQTMITLSERVFVFLAFISSVLLVAVPLITACFAIVGAIVASKTVRNKTSHVRMNKEPSLLSIWWKQLKDKTCIYVKIV